MVVAFAHYCVRVSWENFLFGYLENARIFFFSCLFLAGFIWIFASVCHFSVFVWKEILDFLGQISNNQKIRNGIKKNIVKDLF